MALNRNLDFIQKELRNIRNQNLYRELKYGEISGPYIRFNKKRAINLSSNDYLALASKKIQIQQMQSSSRLIAGNDGKARSTDNAHPDVFAIALTDVDPDGMVEAIVL